MSFGGKLMKESLGANKIFLFAEIAIMAAVICILGPVSIPIGLIPVSLTPFTVFLTVYILGQKLGTISYLIYLLIGLAGVPVFSGFAGGPGKLFGPTGGYLLAFAVMAWIAGAFYDKTQKIWLHIIGSIIALIVCYALGTLWLAWMAHMHIVNALEVAVLPFIGFDIIKIFAAVFLGKAVKYALKKANLLRTV
jgi:biotin transport system substrate-specific component